MAWEQISSGASTAATGQPDKQIAAYASSSGQVIYTVPSGRRFDGYCTSNSSSSATLQINGSNVYWTNQSDATVVIPMSGVAGTVFKMASNVDISLWGVETDV